MFSCLFVCLVIFFWECGIWEKKNTPLPVFTYWLHVRKDLHLSVTGVFKISWSLLYLLLSLASAWIIAALMCCSPLLSLASEHWCQSYQCSKPGKTRNQSLEQLPENAKTLATWCSVFVSLQGEEPWDGGFPHGCSVLCCIGEGV